MFSHLLIDCFCDQVLKLLLLIYGQWEVALKELSQTFRRNFKFTLKFVDLSACEYFLRFFGLIQAIVSENNGEPVDCNYAKNFQLIFNCVEPDFPTIFN